MRRTFVAAALVVTAVAGGAATAIHPAPADDGRYRIAVNVSLSPKAGEALKDQRQGLVVFAFWEGLPIATKMNYASDDGVIGLGNEELHPAGTHAVVSGKTIDRKHLAWVKDLLVLLTVYSAGPSGEDNILDCGSIEKRFAEAHANPVTISCKLIGENEG